MHNVGIKKCQVFVVNEETLSMQVALSFFFHWTRTPHPDAVNCKRLHSIKATAGSRWCKVKGLLLQGVWPRQMKRQSEPSQYMRYCHGTVNHLNRSRVGVAPGHPALTAAPWHVARALLPNTHFHWACTHDAMSKQPQSCSVTLPLTQPAQVSRAGQVAYTEWTKQQRSLFYTVSIAPFHASVLKCQALSEKFGFGVHNFQT